MTGTIVVFVVAALAIAGLIVFLVSRARKKGATSPPPPDDQERAIQVAWVETYGMDRKVAPFITKVMGSQLNCRNGTGWTVGAECVAGMSWADLNACAVAWPTLETKFSETAFAHELLHAKGWREGRATDHFSPEFQAEVARANEALRKAGL